MSHSVRHHQEEISFERMVSVSHPFVKCGFAKTDRCQEFTEVKCTHETKECKEKTLKLIKENKVKLILRRAALFRVCYARIVGIALK